MAPPTRLMVISGLAGAGKGAALRSFEDLGYYCVDNLPPALVRTFVDLCDRSDDVDRAALGIDSRAHGALEEFAAILDALRERQPDVELLFLDADDDVLRRRYSETRRPHPLAVDGDVAAGIRRERELVKRLRERASRVIDTSEFSPHDLRDLLFRAYGDSDKELADIRVQSFAFRAGLPKNADLVFDVRFVANPNYVPEFKPLTGMDKGVAEYVESRPETQEFLNHVRGLLQFVLPRLGREGRAYVTLAFGCTGGRHRSVAIAQRVAGDLRAMGHEASVAHRDLPVSGALRVAGEEAG